MAITAPGADYRQLRGKSITPLQPRVINLHTMAGTLAGTESWFSGSGRAYSHFGVGGGSGELRQWQDLRYRAASDLNGNPYSISIECEDMGPHFPGWSGSNVPQFTEAQIQSLVVLLAWLCARFGIPTTAIRSSCTHERGIGWHRFGIDPWRNPSCPKWSSSAGKACPGDRRIVQIQNSVLPGLGSPPSPPPKDGFLMGLSDKKQDEMYEWLNELRLGRPHKEYGRDWNRDNLLPPIERLLGRHSSTLVTASDRESGDPVYLTDFMTKTLVPHDGPLHQALRWFAGVEGRDPDAVRIDREVLDQIPTVEADA